MTVKIKLVGCDRYNFQGVVYQRLSEDGKKPRVYGVSDTKAAILLRKENEFGRPYFVEWRKPIKSRRS